MTALLLAAMLLVLVPSARAADLHGVTGFDEFAEGHENIGKAVTRRPSLAQDPNYLKHHPSLSRYLHDNPLARAEFEAEADDEAAAEAEEHEEEQRVERSNPDTGRRRKVPSELPRLPPKLNDEGGDE
jgi:hypothetical protein